MPSWQAFVEATRGQAGWPLNVFITPEGYPLTAILYAPPQDFLQYITRLNARWQPGSPGLGAGRSGRGAGDAGSARTGRQVRTANRRAVSPALAG